MSVVAFAKPVISRRAPAWIPAATWLRSYDRRWLRPDLVAAVTLAAYLLPAGIGDASLANLPPQAGLYACLFSGLVFWLFCSARHTAITVTSAISLLVGASPGELAGGDTSRFGALAAAFVRVVVLFFSQLLRLLPQPVLAAVVLVAVTGLFKVDTLRHLRRTNPGEFLVAVIALAGVVTSGLLRGVLIGAIISLVLSIRRASRPNIALLGRIPGSRRFSDHDRHPGDELTPGALVFRPEWGLFYFNMDHVRDTVLERVRAQTARAALVVLDLSAAPHVDMHAAHMLEELATELQSCDARAPRKRGHRRPPLSGEHRFRRRVHSSSIGLGRPLPLLLSCLQPRARRAGRCR